MIVLEYVLIHNLLPQNNPLQPCKTKDNVDSTEYTNNESENLDRHHCCGIFQLLEGWENCIHLAINRNICLVDRHYMKIVLKTTVETTVTDCFGYTKFQVNSTLHTKGVKCMYISPM